MKPKIRLATLDDVAVISLADGSCVRLRSEHKNHVWSYDFVEDKTIDGRKMRWLNIIDESTRECLHSVPRRSWRGNDVIEALAASMILHGTPEYLMPTEQPQNPQKH